MHPRRRTADRQPEGTFTPASLSMAILIENGEVYDPSPLGRRSLLVMGERITAVGDLRRRDAESVGVEMDVIDASGSTVIPGIVDPHQHLLGEGGSSGERSPEREAAGIAAAGVTTAVGCLGSDPNAISLSALLARAKSLRMCGCDVHVWTGGTEARPSLLASACADLVTFTEVIGAADAVDPQCSAPDPGTLASLAADAYLGGMMSGKAGVVHFHVDRRWLPLLPLRRAIDALRVPTDRVCFMLREPDGELVGEAVRCAAWGAFVGVPAGAACAEEWISRYLARRGSPHRLILLSDAPRAHPRSVLDVLVSLAAERTLEGVLPWATSNTAAMLGLRDRGTIRRGRTADLVVLRRDSREVVEVIAGGRRVVRGGEVVPGTCAP